MTDGEEVTEKPVAVVAGASGFVGTALVRAFEQDGYVVRRIGRSGEFTWDDPVGIARAIEGSAVRPESP